MESLLTEILQQLKLQTSLMVELNDQNRTLIAALADEDADDGQREPMTYMDGTPCQ